MDFVGGLPLSKRGHGYLYVVVDRFSKMCILTPCNKQVTTEQTAKFFFKMYGFILVYPLLLYPIEIFDFSGNFGQVYGS